MGSLLPALTSPLIVSDPMDKNSSTDCNSTEFNDNKQEIRSEIFSYFLMCEWYRYCWFKTMVLLFLIALFPFRPWPEHSAHDGLSSLFSQGKAADEKERHRKSRRRHNQAVGWPSDRPQNIRQVDIVSPLHKYELRTSHFSELLSLDIIILLKICP